jgi:hypothetical protein
VALTDGHRDGWSIEQRPLAAAWRRDLLRGIPGIAIPTPKNRSALDLHYPLANFLWIPRGGLSFLLCLE